MNRHKGRRDGWSGRGLESRRGEKYERQGGIRAGSESSPVLRISKHYLALSSHQPLTGFRNTFDAVLDTSLHQTTYLCRNILTIHT